MTPDPSLSLTTGASVKEQCRFRNPSTSRRSLAEPTNDTVTMEEVVRSALQARLSLVLYHFNPLVPRLLQDRDHFKLRRSLQGAAHHHQRPPLVHHLLTVQPVTLHQDQLDLLSPYLACH
jgi:hypothetical protein